MEEIALPDTIQVASNMKPVKGNVCTKYNEKYQLPRYQHTSLGVIHPKNVYQDPRKPEPRVNI
jgi:hypothetical protein